MHFHPKMIKITLMHFIESDAFLHALEE